MKCSTFCALLRRSLSQWSDDRGPTRAAALAFYAGFSLAPLLLIAIAIAGPAFGAEAVRGQVVEELRGLLGTEGARAVEAALKNAQADGKNVLAALAGIATLLLGASGVFGELQDALNVIWKVKKKPGRGVRGFLRDRVLSFTLVLGTGFLLLVSLLVSAAIEALTTRLSAWIDVRILLKLAGVALSFGVVTTMFAMMFRFLPDAVTRWRDVWLGSIFTSLLFTAGKHLIGLYLGHSALASTYGAAGSFVILLLWLYYSSQVFLLGAELTKSYADVYGEAPTPDRDAIPLSPPATPSERSRI